MDSRDILKKVILPPLRKSISIENKTSSSNRSSFGLGTSIGEKKKQQEELQNERFFVDFRLPRHLQSKMHERRFQHLFDEATFSSNSVSSSSKRRMIENAIQLRCCDTDAVSRIPQLLRDMKQDEQQLQQQDQDDYFQQTLSHIKLEALAADPALLFDSMGIEKPFGTPSKRSTMSSAKLELLSGGEHTNNNNLLSGGGAGANQLRVLPKEEDHNDESLPLSDFTQQRDESSLALPSSSTASELALWRFKGMNFADYRRNMYTIGTDSIFSVGAISRPIRLASMNFLSYQADAVLEKHFYGHLYDHNIFQEGSSSSSSSSLFSKLNLTDEDAEEAWKRAMENSQRAIEACSSLLNERSVVVMSLLRRRFCSKHHARDGINKASYHVMGGVSPTTAGSSGLTNVGTRNESGSSDRDLDIFVRGLRSGFATVEVLPMKRGGGGAKNRIWNRNEQNQESAGEMKSRNKKKPNEPSLFEPVIVVCSNEGGGISSRGTLSGTRLENLPNNDRARLGEFVGGGNQARLEDHYRTGGKYIDRKDPNIERRNEVVKKVKFHIGRYANGYRQNNHPKNFVQTLKPQKLSHVDSTASKERTQVWNQRKEQNRKMAEIYQDFTTDTVGGIEKKRYKH